MNDELIEFRDTDFCKRCEDWLRTSLKEDGPILFSALGQGHFLPDNVDVRDWVQVIPGIFSHAGLGSDNYCESIECVPDKRPPRRSSLIFPRWMRNGVVVSADKKLFHVRYDTKKRWREWLSSVAAFFKRFCFGWLSGTGRHVHRKTWNHFVRQLKADKRWTVWVKYRDGRQSFTASEFLRGDEDAMLLKSRGRVFEVRREDALEIQLVPVIREDGRLKSCRISAWYEEREFGFAKDEENNCTYFFSKALIHDYALLQSLFAGVTGQRVKCRVIAPPMGKKYAKIEILAYENQMESYGVEVSVKSRAIRAEHSGDIGLAESLYLGILKNPAHPDFETALKNLAGIYNRTDSNRALELLSKYEKDVSDECKETLEHLRFLYFKRAGRMDEAYDTAKRLLKRAPNPVYERFVEQYNERNLQGKCVNDVSFLPSETRYGEFLVRNLDFGGWFPGDADVDDVKARYIEMRERCAKTVGWGVAAAKARADYSLRRCALNYWISEKIGAPGWEGWGYEKEGKRILIGIGQMRNEWRQYFFWLAASKISSDVYDRACVVADLVNSARCARRPKKGEWDYCQLAIPLVIVSLVLKRKREDILAVFEAKRKDDVGLCSEEEIVQLLLGKLAETKELLDKDDVARNEVLRIVKDYSILKILPYFRNLVESNEENEGCLYDDILDKVMVFTGRSEADLSEKMIRSAERIIQSVNNLDNPTSKSALQVSELVNKGLAYAGAVSYADKKRLYEDMGIIWRSFTERCVREAADLIATDVYFPVVGFVMDCLQTDMARRSMSEVQLSLHVDNEEIVLGEANSVSVGVTLKSLSVASPTIISAAFFVNRKFVSDADDQTPAEIYPGQNEVASMIDGADGINGGESYSFSLNVVPTQQERAAGMGAISVLVQYTTDGGFKGKKEFECSYKLVDKAELLPGDNPYSSQQGTVGDVKFFVGRRKELARIRKRFMGSIGGQCFVLWGQRRSGKSSICEKFKEELSADRSDVIYCYLDAQSWSNDLERRFTDFLCADVERQCGQVAGLQEIRDDAYDIRLNHVADFLHQIGKTLIVALDEASTPYNNYLDRGMHDEDKHKAIDFMRFLKSRVNGARNFHLLLIGQDTMKDFLEDSCFANEFAVTWEEPLNYLSEEDIRELFRRGFPRMKNGQERLTDDAFNELYRLVRGAPYFAQIFLYWLYEYLYENGLPVADVTEIKATVEILCHGGEGGEGRLGWRNFEQWTNLRVPGISEDDAREFYRRVALKTKDGIWCTAAELASTEIGQKVMDIAKKRHILEEQDGKFRLLVELFAEWLLANECQHGGRNV